MTKVRRLRLSGVKNSTLHHALILFLLSSSLDASMAGVFGVMRHACECCICGIVQGDFFKFGTNVG